MAGERKGVVQAIHTVVKGRARFRVKGLYASDTLKEFICARLADCKGIQSVSVNTLTGSVLVFYNSNNTHLTVASVIKTIVSEYGKGKGLEKSSPPPRRPEQNRPDTRQKAANPAAGNGRHKGIIAKAEGQRAGDWHLAEAKDVIRALTGSGDHGLTSIQATERLKMHGPNILSESVPRSGLSIFTGQFKSLPVVLLGVAAAISVATGGVADALVIVSVVGINAVIGYLTESRAESTIQSLKNIVKPSAHVLRDGAVKEIRADDVVVGDILALKPGSYVAADARLIELHRLSVDESSLTGESMPAVKTIEPISGRNIPLGDRSNMVYMGTLVTGGQGLAIVVATGRFTEISRIQALVMEAEPPETPMQRQLDRMGTQLVLISGGVCGLVFLIGLLRGYGVLQMLKTSISLAVAAVPEGLPTVATTTLALGIGNMRRHKVLIRRLDAVETLGSVQTLCLDKTGTITINRMSVVSVHTGLRAIKVLEGAFTDGREMVNPYSCDELLRLIHAAVLCNESEVVFNGREYTVNGSPTENALVHMAISSGVDVAALRERHPLSMIKHRSENRNFMSTLHSSVDNTCLVAIKGSPAEVLAMCSCYMKDGKAMLFKDSDRLLVETANERMAGDALRVLGAAYYVAADGEGLGKEAGFIWLGLVGMADPIRKGVKDSIAAIHRAGIDTVMITGDQSPTAYAIGKELELSGNGHLEILDSTHLADIDPEVLKALSEKVHVFSRVSPAHKLQIVQSLQRAGRVVAMTGDGINDSPALKAADIGIAMGHTGTDVAREVADVVLEDDDIETMIIAISQGRTIYNNIRKSVHFLLSTNLSEIMVMFTSIAGGLGAPLNAMQLLWINLISDIAPGLALALEPPEPDVLSRPPRNPEEPIIKTSDFKRIFFESAVLSAGALGAYGYGIARYGMGQRAGTMAFMSLTSGQILHSISCRSESPVIFAREKLPPNKYLNMAVAGSFAVQALALAVPGLRGLLGITPISLIDGAIIGGSAMLPLAINEVTKRGGESR